MIDSELAARGISYPDVLFMARLTVHLLDSVADYCMFQKARPTSYVQKLASLLIKLEPLTFADLKHALTALDKPP